ncbi:hypothetical protein [Candidatus Magnetaquicoccus inordinatus]|uniref:hypothetical protein n=1 Tax=Candidatus Magnetaquicoccus inordinatus TaxID=2496818 RepID=UPI00102BC504|nr:hypothetical protein [Candidatus Magnetaquicoccus inordinatus]
MFQWTQDQKNIINASIAARVEETRMIHKIIPISERNDSTRGVHIDEPKKKGNKKVGIKSRTKLYPFHEIIEPMVVTRSQAADPELTDVLRAVRQAATYLAAKHDRICIKELRKNSRKSGNKLQIIKGNGSKSLISAVMDALLELQKHGYIDAYFLILGNELYVDAIKHGKNKIEALLNSDTIFSSTNLGKQEGLLISCAVDVIDMVISVPPQFEHLRDGKDGNPECRVYEEFRMRLKDKDSIVRLVRE